MKPTIATVSGARFALCCAALFCLALGTAAATWPAYTIFGLLGLFLTWLVVRHVRFTPLRTNAFAGVRLDLVLLPSATGLGAQSAVLGLAAVATIACVALVSHRVERPTAPLIALLLASAPVWLRGGFSPVALTAAGVVLVALTCRDGRRAVTSLIDGIGLYLVVNVVAYYGLGLRSPSLRTAGLETTVGAFGERVIFPFTSSLAVPGVMAAVYLTGIGAMIAVKHGKREGVFIPAAILVLLATNNRGALLGATLIVGLLLAVRHKFILAAPVLAIGILLIPFYLAQSSAALEPLSRTAAAEALQRDNDNRATYFNGRDVIWSLATEYHSSFVDGYGQWLGYGPRGTEVSGASQVYAQAIGSGFGVDRTATSPHNSALQQLFDAGWVGVALLVLAIGLSLQRLRATALKDPYPLAALAMIVVLTLTGSFEITIAPGGGLQPLWLLIILVGSSFTAELYAQSRRPISALGSQSGREPLCQGSVVRSSGNARFS